MSKNPIVKTVCGFCLPETTPGKNFKDILSYKPRNDDIFVASYPKSGSYWMQYIAVNILRKGKALDDPSDFFRMSPLIDKFGIESIKKAIRPSVFKTHLPFTHIPYSPAAKYIYMVRNPKDCCVSLYHHYKLHPTYDYSHGSFDEFFEAFLEGNDIIYCDYFHHFRSWYPHRKDSNVFFTSFEDTKMNTRNTVCNLAKFLGHEYWEAIQKDNAVLNKILQNISPDCMKESGISSFIHWITTEHADIILKKMSEDWKYDPTLNVGSNEFIRKGEMGDWKNYFTEDQSRRLEARFSSKVEDCLNQIDLLQDNGYLG